MHAYYDQWWENSRDPRSPLFARFEQVVADSIPRVADGAALEIGMGKGAIVRILLARGYKVEGVESNPKFCRDLQNRHPSITVRNKLAQDFRPQKTYDVCTMIQVLQNIPPDDVRRLIARLAPFCKRFVWGVANSHSIHGWWTRFRGFSPDFVYPMSAQRLTRICKENGLVLESCRGIGLLSQVTLLRGFRIKLIPSWIERQVNKIEFAFPMLCHLCCISLVSSQCEE